MKTVLVVDDSKTIRTAVAWTLHSPEIRVRECADVASAREAVASALPDLVLLDAGFGEAMAFCGELKATPRMARTPVLLLSSALEPIEAARVRSAQADGQVPKPFDSQSLIDAVRGGLGLELTDDVPLTYVQQRAREQLRQAAVPSFPPGDIDPEAVRIEPIEIDVEEDEFEAETSPAPAGGPSLEPPPPPVAPPPPVEVDVWALTDEPSAPPPRLPPRSPPPRLPPPVAPARTASVPAAPSAPEALPAMAQAVATAAAGEVVDRLPDLPQGLSREELLTLARSVIEEVVWEVVPDLAETLIREELSRLLAAEK